MGPKKGPQRLQGKGREQSHKRSASATKIDRSLEATTSGKDEQWFQDISILRGAAEKRAHGLALQDSLAPTGDNPFGRRFEYLPVEEQCVVLRNFYERNPDQAVSLLNVALRESSPGERSRIGAALVSSGLVKDAIDRLTNETNGDPYGAFSLLFLAAKAGEIDPLVEVIETHDSIELCLKLVGLLVSSGEREILERFRQLAVNESLTAELHATILQAINQLNSGDRKNTHLEATAN